MAEEAKTTTTKAQNTKLHTKLYKSRKTSVSSSFANKVFDSDMRAYGKLPQGMYDALDETSEMYARDCAEGLASCYFLDLVQRIGQDDRLVAMQVLSMMPEWAKEGAIWDEDFGLFVRLGEAPVMFTSHLDTVAKSDHNPKIELFKWGGELFASSNGKDILGADCRAGIALMLRMMHAGVEGLYAFFTLEESGCIGSRAYDKSHDLTEFNCAVSFDRRGYQSVITHQNGKCASNEFARALANALEKEGLPGYEPDPTGVYTDSAHLVDQISECTNLSIGYFDQHSSQETQNLTYLTVLGEALCKIDWAGLPAERKLSDTGYGWGGGGSSYSGYAGYGSSHSRYGTDWDFPVSRSISGAEAIARYCEAPELDVESFDEYDDPKGAARKDVLEDVTEVTRAMFELLDDSPHALREVLETTGILDALYDELYGYAESSA